MKAMILSDLIILRRSALQLLGMAAAVTAILCVGMGSLEACFSAVGVMLPLLLLFTVMAIDEANRWEGYRLTLPLGRTQVVCGRYGSYVVMLLASLALGLLLVLIIGGIATVVGAAEGPLARLTFENLPLPMLLGMLPLLAAIDLVFAALTLPFMLRFGMTRGVRLLPIALALLIVAVIELADSGMLGGFFQQLVYIPEAASAGDDLMPLLVLSAKMLAGAVVLFAASAVVSTRLYQSREF